jgi:hypothetical protein
LKCSVEPFGKFGKNVENFLGAYGVRTPLGCLYKPIAKEFAKKIEKVEKNF